jgi:hypothetical protein
MSINTAALRICWCFMSPKTGEKKRKSKDTNGSYRNEIP